MAKANKINRVNEMDPIEEQKIRMRNRRNKCVNGNKKTDENAKTYVNLLIMRVLISIIIFFVAVIVSNTTKIGDEFIRETVLKDNMSFTEIANIYNKYFGNIIPFENLVKDDQTVFSEKLSYEEIMNYKDGYELKVKKNYLVPVINSGIVVFIGEKEGYGNTVIIQGIDEVDYWYSNVTNLSCSLYDYVSKGNFLGTADGEKMYLTFKKGSEFLDRDEVIE